MFAPTLKHISGTSGRDRLPWPGMDVRWASFAMERSLCGWKGQRKENDTVSGTELMLIIG